jgi:iron complex transport system substrate-binding protein
LPAALLDPVRPTAQTRRGLLTGAGALLALSACTAPPANPQASRVTIEHKYGKTTIPSAPGRVVTVGLSDHDAVLALGVRPVGVTDWYGDQPYATWPWARPALGSARPTVMPRGEDKLNFEKIAALRPDLIIGQYAGMTREEFDKASQIAPTVPQSGKYPDYGAPWQEMTRVIGRALGRPADALIARVEADFAAARKKYPQFAGRTAVVAEMFEGNAVFARSASDPRTRFLTDLGFVLPPDIAKLAGDKDGFTVSPERLDLLDRDLLVWNAGFNPAVRSALAANRVYQGLKVVRERRALILSDNILSGALTWSTVLSLPYAVWRLAPMLATTLAGR